MAPRTVALVFRSVVLVLFLCVISVFGHSSGYTYTREELLNYRTTTPVDLFPVFVASAADLLHTLLRRVRRRRRGKRAGSLVRLRRRGLRTALPGIFLSNVRSLRNKMDELALMRSINRDFSSSCVLCFTESWLGEDIPDCALHLEGFQLYRADRQAALSGKTTGGGVCLFINSGWCTDVTVIAQHCSPSLEYLFIHCKPFYSPREFASFILAAVYIPPDADVHAAQCALAEQTLLMERTYPDSLVIVLGDFNKANLSQELPKYKQYIKCPTREERTLDHCYSTISGAYHAVPRAALGLSDHVMSHLIPAYRQRLKHSKPVVRTTKRWSSEAMEELRTCLETTDWDAMRAASDSLDEYTDTVTSYIHFCEDSIVPSRTRVSYNNDKPWFTPKLKQLWLVKREAFRSGDKDLYKDAKYRFSREVGTARLQFSQNMQQQISEDDSASVWRSFRKITNYKPKTPHSTDDLSLANSLNDFYCRFDESSSSSHTSNCPNNRDNRDNPDTHPPTVSPSPEPSPPFHIHEADVKKQFKRMNAQKASGPDGVSPATLRHCANELPQCLRASSILLCRLVMCLLQNFHHCSCPQEAKDHRTQ